MRIGRTILVWAVAVLTAVDSASACRWSCYSSYSYCSPAPCYSRTYVSCPPSYCPICAAGSAPTTTHRATPPTPPTPPTPQPTLEPAPKSVAPAPFAEPAPFEPPAPPPTEPPAAAPPALEPPAEPAPAAKPGAEVEDLFREPGAAPAPTPAPPPTPSETPAAPADNVDDLFKDPTPAAPAPMPADKPADKPAEAPPADKPADVEDLFKDVEKKSTSVEPAPATTPTADREVESLFAEPSDASGSKTSADESRAIEEEADKLFDEQPAQPSASAAQPPAEGAMRLWTDNTGKYHVRARLVDVGDGHVRLLKETGKYTTVPFARLSQGDLAFVRQQADRAIVANF